jgi:hypothetical protein
LKLTVPAEEVNVPRFDQLPPTSSAPTFDAISVLPDPIVTVAYEYADGKYYYASAFDRKLAGFGKVTRVDSAGNKTVSYFHQGDSSNTSSGEYQDHDSKIGKVYRVEQQNSSGVAFAVTINKWDRGDTVMVAVAGTELVAPSVTMNWNESVPV